jgi:anti-anti-sigma factor
MKSESGKAITASLDVGGGVGIVQLAEAEYGSLDTQKLACVRGLLLDQAEKLIPRYLVVDLSAVHFFGASFIGTLVDTWDRLRKRNRRLVLCGLTPFCSKLIRTLHLGKLFEIYATQPIALAQIGQPARCYDGAARSRGIRVRKSEVAWDPNLLRLEYIGEDNVPFRSIIVPRREA